MRIYADSSFLISLLNRGEKQHQPARRFYLSHPTAEWVTSAWSQFETLNGLRQLCLAAPGNTPEQAEALRRLFKHWHERGNFTFEPTEPADAIQECSQISSAHATALRMRSADVLHVALLEQIEHDLFVTRDRDQHALAVSRAFKSQLLP